MAKKTNEIQNEVKNEEKKEFNYFDYFKFNLLKAYYKTRLEGGNVNEFEFTLKYVDTNKNVYFYKTGALKFAQISTTYDENGRVVTLIKVKDLDVNKKAISKAGKEYSVFNTYDKAKAFSSAEKALASV